MENRDKEIIVLMQVGTVVTGGILLLSGASNHALSSLALLLSVVLVVSASSSLLTYYLEKSAAPIISNLLQLASGLGLIVGFFTSLITGMKFITFDNVSPVGASFAVICVITFLTLVIRTMRVDNEKVFDL